MRYTFLEEKYNNKFNKYKLFEYDQFDDDEDDEDEEDEYIDQEKKEQLSYAINDVEQLCKKLSNEDISLEDKEKYIKINKRLLNEWHNGHAPLMEACIYDDFDIVNYPPPKGGGLQVSTNKT